MTPFFSSTASRYHDMYAGEQERAVTVSARKGLEEMSLHAVVSTSLAIVAN